ncbi:MAG TPA: hypothetical protein VH370_22950 [Humisphaera sp.]|nr:hypothetical protein [Humisphaera sp.]
MPLKSRILTSNLPPDFESLVQVHPPRPIHDNVSYRNTQETVDALTNLPRRTMGQEEYLETLTVLMAKYEDDTETIGEGLSPLEIVKHLMQEHGMSASDLGRELGERSLGPKILNGHRELSKQHIRKLAEYFGVRADLFL